MRLSLRPLAFAILLAGTAGGASAADLMQAYELARQSDPVLAAAESERMITGEGVDVGAAYPYSKYAHLDLTRIWLPW